MSDSLLRKVGPEQTPAVRAGGGWYNSYIIKEITPFQRIHESTDNVIAADAEIASVALWGTFLNKNVVAIDGTDDNDESRHLRDRQPERYVAYRFLELFDNGRGVSQKLFTEEFLVRDNFRDNRVEEGVGMYNQGRHTFSALGGDCFVASQSIDPSTGRPCRLLVLFSADFADDNKVKGGGKGFRLPYLIFEPSEQENNFAALREDSRYDALVFIADLLYKRLDFDKAEPLTGANDCGRLGVKDDSCFANSVRVRNDFNRSHNEKSPKITDAEITDFLRFMFRGMEGSKTGSRSVIARMQNTLIAVTRPNDRSWLQTSFKNDPASQTVKNSGFSRPLPNSAYGVGTGPDQEDIWLSHKDMFDLHIESKNGCRKLNLVHKEKELLGAEMEKEITFWRDKYLAKLTDEQKNRLVLEKLKEKEKRKREEEQKKRLSEEEKKQRLREKGRWDEEEQEEEQEEEEQEEEEEEETSPAKSKKEEKAEEKRRLQEKLDSLTEDEWRELLHAKVDKMLEHKIRVTDVCRAVAEKNYWVYVSDLRSLSNSLRMTYAPECKTHMIVQGESVIGHYYDEKHQQEEKDRPKDQATVLTKTQTLKGRDDTVEIMMGITNTMIFDIRDNVETVLRKHYDAEINLNGVKITLHVGWLYGTREERQRAEAGRIIFYKGRQIDGRSFATGQRKLIGRQSGSKGEDGLLPSERQGASVACAVFIDLDYGAVDSETAKILAPTPDKNAFNNICIVRAIDEVVKKRIVEYVMIRNLRPDGHGIRETDRTYDECVDLMESSGLKNGEKVAGKRKRKPVSTRRGATSNGDDGSALICPEDCCCEICVLPPVAVRRANKRRASRITSANGSSGSSADNDDNGENVQSASEEIVESEEDDYCDDDDGSEDRRVESVAAAKKRQRSGPLQCLLCDTSLPVPSAYRGSGYQSSVHVVCKKGGCADRKDFDRGRLKKVAENIECEASKLRACLAHLAGVLSQVRSKMDPSEH